MVNVSSGLKLYLVKNSYIKIFIRFDEYLNNKKRVQVITNKNIGELSATRFLSHILYPGYPSHH